MEAPADLPVLLFGPGPAAEVRALSPRLAAWSAAFTAWLDSIQAGHGPLPYGQALQAWKLLLDFHRCPPWDLDRLKLDAWLADLAESGYTPNTIRAYRGRISAFYRYCSQCAPTLFTGDPYFAGRPNNPLRGAVKAKAINYQHAYVLTAPEARSLLRAVDRHSSLVAQRDYAFLLTLLLTGLPETGLRLLRWQDLEVGLGGARLPQTGLEFPTPAWQAVLDHLRRSGRLPALLPEHYLFVPLADPLLHPPTGLAGDWANDRPLSTEQLLVSLKCYASWAGLDSERITYAALRHTAAALHLASGADAAGLQRFLGRLYLKETRRYITLLGQMLTRRRTHRPWVARRLGRLSPNPYLRKSPHAQPGNLNAIRHGFLTRRFRPADLQDLDGILTAGLEDEIAALRVILRRSLRLTGRSKDLPETLHLLDHFGLAAARIARLLREQSELQTPSPDQVLSQAISEVLEELSTGE
ncbi:MAG TPA: tyrosine-type recombinase/integrase [Anaerolineales bacterium]